LTNAKNREEWYSAWSEKASELYGAYQCKADPVLFDRLDAEIKTIKKTLFEISNRLDTEGTFKELKK